MENIDFFPLGSIVIIRGGVKKTMIIARGIAADVGGGPKRFDYGGCLYPEGLLGDQILYFNHEDVNKVVFTGFSDEDNELMVENINGWIKNSGFEKGNPLEINKKNSSNNG